MSNDNHSESSLIEARLFEIDLTEAEKKERRELANVQVGQLEIARLEEKDLAKQKKAEVAELEITKLHADAKKRADQLEIEMRKNAKAGREGKESRWVDCRWEMRRSDFLMILRRQDTGKEVARRPATREEIERYQQGNLDFDETVN